MIHQTTFATLVGMLELLQKKIQDSSKRLSHQMAHTSGRLPNQLCMINPGWQMARDPFRMITFPVPTAAQATAAARRNLLDRTGPPPLRQVRAEGGRSVLVAQKATHGQRCTMVPSARPLALTMAQLPGICMVQRMSSNQARPVQCVSAMALDHTLLVRSAARNAVHPDGTCGVTHHRRTPGNRRCSIPQNWVTPLRGQEASGINGKLMTGTSLICRSIVKVLVKARRQTSSRAQISGMACQEGAAYMSRTLRLMYGRSSHHNRQPTPTVLYGGIRMSRSTLQIPPSPSLL